MQLLSQCGNTYNCLSRSVPEIHSHVAGTFTLNVLYHTFPRELCRCEVKDVHCLQSFISTHCEESHSLLFILCLQYQMLSTSAFLKENSTISLEEWVSVFKVFTIAARKLTIKQTNKHSPALACSRRLWPSGEC